MGWKKLYKFQKKKKKSLNEIFGSGNSFRFFWGVGVVWEFFFIQSCLGSYSDLSPFCTLLCSIFNVIQLGACRGLSWTGCQSLTGVWQWKAEQLTANPTAFNICILTCASIGKYIFKPISPVLFAKQQS